MTKGEQIHAILKAAGFPDTTNAAQVYGCLLQGTAGMPARFWSRVWLTKAEHFYLTCQHPEVFKDEDGAQIPLIVLDHAKRMPEHLFNWLSYDLKLIGKP